MSDPYIDITIDADPDLLAQLAYDYIQSQIPGWLPAQGNLETWQIRALAEIGSEIMAVGAQVPAAIFRKFGAEFFAVDPIDAVPATATATVTAINTSGYTLPAGALVAIRKTGDELVFFTVDTDVVIPAGASVTAAGAIKLTAISAGAAANGVTGTVEDVDGRDWISSITIATAPAGGVTEETDDEYLDRLRTNLQTLSLTPITITDFEKLAPNVPGVARVAALDLVVPGSDEVQTLLITGASSGTFTITWSGQTTAAIAWNATAAAVQAALEALPNIGVGNILVAGGPMNGTTATLTFRGALARANQAQITVTSGGLGGAPVVTIATTTNGAADTLNVANAVALVGVDTAGEVLGAQTKADLDAYMQARRQTNFLVAVTDATYTTIAAQVVLVAVRGYSTTTVQADVASALATYLSPANWALSVTGPPWRDAKSIRYGELMTLINNVAGVDYVTSLSLAVTGGAYFLLVKGTASAKGYWRLGETSGNALDSVGANPGTVSGTGVTRSQAGAITGDPDASMLFDGVNGNISIADAAVLDLADALTLSVWVKRVGVGTAQTLIDKGVGAYKLGFDATNKFFLAKNGTATIVTSTVAVAADGAWHNIVATKSAGTTILYLDGVDVTGTVTNQTLADTATALNLAQNSAAAERYSGYLDDVAVFNAALTAAEVQARYRAGYPQADIALAGTAPLPRAGTITATVQSPA